MKLLFIVWLFLANALATGKNNGDGTGNEQPFVVRRCNDFVLTGKGDNPTWQQTEWQLLQKLDPEGESYETTFKVLYSAKGIYVLFHARDNKITTDYDQDFGDLYRGDVFEVFLQPDPAVPLYLEYEINALKKELVLLVPHMNNKFFGWKPWHYEKGRRVTRMVNVEGGKAEKNAAISSWTAELFFPFELLQTLSNVPPVSGTVWKANFYRLDYDSGSMVKWAWSPVKQTFHEYKQFRSIRFE